MQKRNVKEGERRITNGRKECQKKEVCKCLSQKHSHSNI